MICGCRLHNELLRAAHRGQLTASSPGLGADHSTRSFGQAKEPWTGPMRSGDPLGDHRQRAITLALIFVPIFANQDSVGPSAPLTHQSCAGLRHDAESEGATGFLELSGQGLQTASLRPAHPAMGLLLQLMSKGSD